MPLSNEQYDEIMRRYDLQRQADYRIYKEHVNEIHQRIPEIKALDDEGSSAFMERALLRINAASQASPDKTSMLHRDAKTDEFAKAGNTPKQEDSIRSLIISNEKKKKQLLIKHGYPEDYLEMPYKCPVCEDTGYVNGRKCACFKNAELELLYESSRLSNVLKKENFAHFSFHCYSDNIEDGENGQTPRALASIAYERARHFAEGIGEPGNDLLIYGKTGVGKSFLSHCIAKEALEKSFSTLYFSAQDLFDALADSDFGRTTDEKARLIYECDLLIIDDLGTELTNNFVNTRLFYLVNERAAAHRSTIISTNLSIEELAAKYSERIFSRIMSSYNMIKLIGNDIRIQNKLTGD